MIFDCADKPKKGVDGGKAVAINWDDIDWAATTISGSTITDLVLKAGKSGFAVEWFGDLASANSAFAASDEDMSGYLHNFLTRIATSSAAGAERAAELSQGRFVFALETRYKGVDNLEAFKVMGIENGVKLTEMTWSTLENSGSLLYQVSTKEGDTETYPFNIFLEGASYAVSKATFDSLFATA
jgi:hypothetical protein